MISKTKADYVRNLCYNFDKNLNNSRSHILDLVDFSNSLIYMPNLYQKINNNFERVGRIGFNQYDSNNQLIGDPILSSAGVFNYSDVYVPTEVNSDEQVPPTYTYALTPFHNRIGQESYIGQSYPEGHIPYVSVSVLYLRYLKDVYDYNKINGVITLRGQRLNKDDFWNRFQNYLVPVYQYNDNYKSKGDMLWCFKDAESQRMDFDGLIFSYRQDPTITDTTLYIPDSYSIIYSNVFLGYLFPHKSDFQTPVRQFGQNNKLIFNGVIGQFGFNTELPYKVNGASDYPPKKAVKPINTERQRFGVLSPYLSDFHTENPLAFKEYLIRPGITQEQYDNYLSGYPYNLADYSGEHPTGYGGFYPPQTWSDNQSDLLKQFYMTDICMYYEDLHILDRSFEFEYQDMEHNPCITAYNQEELEHYLNTWKIPFEYAEGWVSPLQPEYESTKIRHILLGRHSDIESTKIRHIMNYRNSDIESTKIRHTIGGV